MIFLVFLQGKTFRKFLARFWSFSIFVFFFFSCYHYLNSLFSFNPKKFRPLSTDLIVDSHPKGVLHHLTCFFLFFFGSLHETIQSLDSQPFYIQFENLTNPLNDISKASSMSLSLRQYDLLPYCILVRIILVGNNIGNIL